MKVGVIGVGAVGSACALALVMRGCAREIVLLDRNRRRSMGVAHDIRYGAAMFPAVGVRDGDYADLAEARVIMITAGVNEKAGGATDRSDPAGRLKLLDTNVDVYVDIVPEVVKVAPQAVILVVTDPPDPLADVTRRFAGHDRVLSTGTFLDSLRFRVQLGQHLDVNPAYVEAQVLGEHGTSEVFLWSSARVAGVPVSEGLAERGLSDEEFRSDVEHEVRYANIPIIEGIGASQYGIGMVSARIAEMVLRDEQAVIPIGSYNPRYGVTLSMPSVLGRDGVTRILEPPMSASEREALQRSADVIKKAVTDASRKI